MWSLADSLIRRFVTQRYQNRRGLGKSIVVGIMNYLGINGHERLPDDKANNPPNKQRWYYCLAAIHGKAGYKSLKDKLSKYKFSCSEPDCGKTLIIISLLTWRFTICAPGPISADQVVCWYMFLEFVLPFILLYFASILHVVCSWESFHRLFIHNLFQIVCFMLKITEMKQVLTKTSDQTENSLFDDCVKF